jgi:hypothetical protein
MWPHILAQQHLWISIPVVANMSLCQIQYQYERASLYSEISNCLRLTLLNAVQVVLQAVTKAKDN